jgi:hypothetical protein
MFPQVWKCRGWRRPVFDASLSQSDLDGWGVRHADCFMFLSYTHEISREGFSGTRESCDIGVDWYYCKDAST